MSDKITHIGDVKKDARLMLPADALNAGLRTIGDIGALKDGKKVLVLALDDTDGKYDISFFQAGMTMSQCVALCEIGKAEFLTEMGIIPRD